MKEVMVTREQVRDWQYDVVTEEFRKFLTWQIKQLNSVTASPSFLGHPDIAKVAAELGGKLQLLHTIEDLFYAYLDQEVFEEELSEENINESDDVS